MKGGIRKCHNTYFINALISKLIDPKDQQQNKNTEGNEKGSGDGND